MLLLLFAVVYLSLFSHMRKCTCNQFLVCVCYVLIPSSDGNVQGKDGRWLVPIENGD